MPTRQNVSAVLGLSDGEGWTGDGELVGRRGGEAEKVKELPDDALWLMDAATSSSADWGWRRTCRGFNSRGDFVRSRKRNATLGKPKA